MRFLTVELAAGRAIVAHQDSAHPDPLVQSCKGFLGDAAWGTDEICRQLLERLSLEAAALMADDSPPSRGRSMLVAPLRHRSGRLMGFLYGDRPLDEGGYAQTHVHILEVFARRYSQVLGELLGSNRRGPSGADPEEVGPPAPEIVTEELGPAGEFPQGGAMVALDGLYGRMIVEWI